MTRDTPLGRGLAGYLRAARLLAEQVDRPMLLVLARMLAGRTLYSRGPHEFDIFGFADKPVRAWREYIMPAELLSLQQAAAPPDVRHMEEDKLRFAQHCLVHHLPTVHPLAVMRRETTETAPDAALEAVAPSIRSGEALAAFFSTHGHFDGFVKPIGGGQGYGAFGIRVRDGQLQPRRNIESAEDLFRICTSPRLLGQGSLIQPLVQPHPTLAVFMPNAALGTIRVNSWLLREDRVLITSAALKVPAPGAESDFPLFGSIMVPVHVESGALGTAVGATRELPVTHAMATHPQSGAAFAGVVVPHWAEVRGLVDRAARAFRMLPALGWDVAITPTGPVLLETNWQFSSRMPERTAGRGQAREFREWFAALASPAPYGV